MYTAHQPTTGRFLNSPNRIAIAGDWHADTRYAVEAIEHAAKRNANVVVHLGDFGYRFTDAYLDALDAALTEFELVLGFVDGNHEAFDALLARPVAPDGLRYLRERIVHLPRGLRWSWGSTTCLAMGGAYSIDRFLRIEGTSWWPQETIDTGEMDAAITGGLADVMFCHDCPAGIPVPGMQRDRYGFPPRELAASEANRQRLREIVDHVQPARLWHGHFHHRHQALLHGTGYRTLIDGLGRNHDPIDNNMVVVNLADLGRHRWSCRGQSAASAPGFSTPEDLPDGVLPSYTA